MKSLLFIIGMISIYQCSPSVTIDYNDPEIIQAMEKEVYGSDPIDDSYAIRMDTMFISANELTYLVTILRNGDEVHSEVRSETLCPDWMKEGKEWYVRTDVVRK